MIDLLISLKYYMSGKLLQSVTKVTVFICDILFYQ